MSLDNFEFVMGYKDSKMFVKLRSDVLEFRNISQKLKVGRNGLFISENGKEYLALGCSSPPSRSSFLYFSNPSISGGSDEGLRIDFLPYLKKAHIRLDMDNKSYYVPFHERE